MLVNGRWTEDWQPVQATDARGGFVRQTSRFRSWVTPDGAPGPTGEGGFPAEAGRYRLYVALICPWASRALIGRALKGLVAAIEAVVVEPELGAQGWRFGTGAPRGLAPCADPELGATWMHEIYTAAAPRVCGRATVPVLWDTVRRTIVNNESADILRMLNTGFGALASDAFDLCPADLREPIEALNAEVYAALNNGVYRAGFATTQGAYEDAVADVFAMLGRLDARLAAAGPFLFGERATEADIRLFVTTVRFDAAYHGLFKCNLRRLTDYPALTAHAGRMLDLPGVRATVSLDHIRRGYHSIRSLNPAGIVPVGPALPWDL